FLPALTGAEFTVLHGLHVAAHDHVRFRRDALQQCIEVVRGPTLGGDKEAQSERRGNFAAGIHGVLLRWFAVHRPPEHSSGTKRLEVIEKWAFASDRLPMRFER